MKQIHTHDCNDCEFVGTMRINEMPFDWHVCRGLSHVSVIARSGSEPSDYWSMPGDVLSTALNRGDKMSALAMIACGILKSMEV